MRTLQKLQYVTPPSEHHVQRIRNAERRGIARKEERTWHIRLFRLMAFIVGPIAVVLLAIKLWSLRIVADGLAHANVVIVVAPSRARVAEVLVEPGQHVQRGDPLARLEALDRDQGLPRRELVLEEARLRLALVEAGGDLGDTDLTRRSERVSEAARRAELARASAQVADADVATLTAQREELDRRIARDRQARIEDVARIEASLAASRGEIDAANARVELLDFEARQAEQLASEGISTERARVTAHAELTASQATIEGIFEVTESLEEELAAVRHAMELEAARGEAALSVADAQITGARRSLELIELEEQLWLDLLRDRREIGPGDDVERAELRRMELQLARTAVHRAEAELAAYDLEIGHGVLRADKAGRVDRVFVSPGAVLAEGEPVARMYDPADMTVLAWVNPRRVDDLRVGGLARVFPGTGGEALGARITSVDDVWSLAPDQLPHLQADSGSYMVPVVIECAELEERARLVPNMRVRVVFRTLTSELRPETTGSESR